MPWQPPWTPRADGPLRFTVATSKVWPGKMWQKARSATPARSLDNIGTILQTTPSPLPTHRCVGNRSLTVPLRSRLGFNEKKAGAFAPARVLLYPALRLLEVGDDRQIRVHRHRAGRGRAAAGAAPADPREAGVGG